jgi:hypothetical protein
MTQAERILIEKASQTKQIHILLYPVGQHIRRHDSAGFIRVASDGPDLDAEGTTRRLRGVSGNLSARILRWTISSAGDPGCTDNKTYFVYNMNIACHIPMKS